MSFTSAGAAAPEPPSRWSDVYLAAVARGVSTCGDFLAATALVLALQGSGAGGFAVAALLLAKTIPMAALAPVAGRIADRVDSRTVLVVAGLGQAVTCAALAFVSHPVAVIALVTLLSVGLAVTQPTLAALVPAMVRKEDLARAGAISQTAATTGMMAGPALAGVLVGQFGATVPLLIDAVSYLALVAAGLLLHTRRGGAAMATAGDGDGGRPAKAWSLWRDPLLRAMVVAIAAVVGAVGAINVAHVFLVRETLGASETVFGIIEAVEMAGMLVGAWLFARLARRTADDRFLVWGVLVQLGVVCLLLPVAAVVATALWLIPLWVLAGLFNGGMNVFSGVAMANRVPAESRGRAFATFGGTIQAAGMFGFFAGGVLVEQVPIRPLFAAAGLAGVAVVLALVPSTVRATRAARLDAAPTDHRVAAGEGAEAAPSATTGPVARPVATAAGYGGNHE
ncbi:MFS transporter [Polymorphospora sp. NPDC050346]|uniref:MFS transporter n=1 Tax=Polymorphospora sp. NPDC050346 TaxID=3155780 RepID=UPI00340B7974